MKLLIKRLLDVVKLFLIGLILDASNILLKWSIMGVRHKNLLPFCITFSLFGPLLILLNLCLGKGILGNYPSFGLLFICLPQILYFVLLSKGLILLAAKTGITALLFPDIFPDIPELEE